MPSAAAVSARVASGEMAAFQQAPCHRHDSRILTPWLALAHLVPFEGPDPIAGLRTPEHRLGICNTEHSPRGPRVPGVAVSPGDEEDTVRGAAGVTEVSDGPGVAWAHDRRRYGHV